MKKIEIEKFTLQTIAGAVRGSDVESVRSLLSFAVGALLDVSGRVVKVVKRDGQMKLVIEPGELLGFVVFADCGTDAEAVISRKIRKGSAVSVKGNLQSFGWSAACLTDCRLQKPEDEVRTSSTQKRNGAKLDKV